MANAKRGRQTKSVEECKEAWESVKDSFPKHIQLLVTKAGRCSIVDTSNGFEIVEDLENLAGNTFVDGIKVHSALVGLRNE